MYFLDELQVIDWEVNSDKEDPGGPSECEDDEGTLDISDCDSCASLTSDDRLCEPSEVRTDCLKIYYCSYNIGNCNLGDNTC